MDELLNYGFTSDDEMVKHNTNKSKISESDEETLNQPYLEEEYEEEEEYEFGDDIPLYDLNLTFSENFEDGSTVKYALLPIYKKPRDGQDYTPLLNAGAKVIMNKNYEMTDYSEALNYLVFDYDPIFGLRLLTFQKYDSTKINCDERVFFETLIIKFRRFGYKKFFYSFSELQQELGISKDRAKSIIKKFNSMGFLETEIITSSIKTGPSQVTFYKMKAKKIVEVIPEIFKTEFVSDMTEKISEYLKPALENEEVNNR